MGSSLSFDLDLVRRYSGSGPRYTSYPTAPHFSADFGEAAYRERVAASNAVGGPLSLYLHLPFCSSPCFYCACPRVITRQPQIIDRYVTALRSEIALQGGLYDGNRTVSQMAWGGGTPTYLTPAQMTALMTDLNTHFDLDTSDAREFTMEIDPRTVDTDSIGLMAALGFNRASLGVQDFDIDVQRAVNRIQSKDQVARVLDELRRVGFQSVNFDLIYGLPRQSVTGFNATLSEVILRRPDRIALYSYAHMPQLFSAQRQIHDEDMPSAETKLALMALAIERLTAAGYVYIGMDHFALPDDELAVAQREGRLYRNFQGYSTHRGCDLVGMGMSAISSVADSYSQHGKSIPDYQQALAEGHLPVQRGVHLSDDDRLRRDVIQGLMCHNRLDFAPIEARHGIVFNDYFARELESLRALADDALINVDAEGIDILDRGRLLLRPIAMVFDAYLKAPDIPARFSRVI